MQSMRGVRANSPLAASSIPRAPRVGYVLKMYPRYSETFIVSEILAHEEAGLKLEIFSLRPPSDGHFQDIISRVKSAVTYIPSHTPDAEILWDTITSAGSSLPRFWSALTSCGNEPVKNIYQAVLLAQLFDAKGITHVHAHFASLATSVGKMAAAFVGLPYTFTAHAKDLFHESVDPADLGRKLREAAGTVTVSDYNVRFLEDRYGTAAKKVRRIYNGLHLERFPYRSPDAESTGIVAVGRLVEKKGFGDLIAACALMRDRGQSVRCSIIGAGPLHSELHAQISDLALEHAVELPGPLPQNEVIARVQSARVFAAPCVDAADGNREGLPTVLIEAMALGTPCVASDVTGISELAIHEHSGLLTRPHDVDGLAGALELLLSDPHLCGRLSENARVLVEERFDIRRNTALLRQLFAAARIADEEAA